MGQTLDCFGKVMEFTQLHRPEEAIPDSSDKCEPGLSISRPLSKGKACCDVRSAIEVHVITDIASF